MPTQFCHYWRNWIHHQFDVGDWTTLPEAWEDNFWGLYDPVSSLSLDFSSAEKETDEDRDVIIPH